MSDTNRANAKQTLPAIIGAPRPGPSLSRYSLPASFASQLIASHQHLPIQRERRRAPASAAQNAYANGLTITVKRMPAGYRFTSCA